MLSNSFQFGGYNSLEDWGIQVISHDFLLPPKNPRKIKIPGRHGKYDYGAKTFDERELRIECVLTRKISRAELREIAYILSKKRQLSLWNEGDKYYIAELYDNFEIIDFPNEVMREFELTFICEPFAYKEVDSLALSTGVNSIHYKGTADTPCLIVLKNNNPYPINNITITATKRRM